MTAPRTPPSEPEVAELRRRLQAAEAELARTSRQLAKVESSSAYRLGAALVRAARRPGRAAVTLPRDVLDVYRSRRAPGRAAPPARGRGGAPTSSHPTGPARATAAAPGPSTGTTMGDVVAAGFAAQLSPRSHVTVAGVLHPATARALGGELLLSPLPPDGGREVLHRVAPDLLLVDATATATGAWAGIGTYIAPSRERRLAEILAAARDLGVPTVLWDPLGPERVPALHEAMTFDVVLDGSWSPGVRMADHHADPGSARAVEVLAAGDADVLGDPAASTLVDELTGLVPQGLRLALEAAPTGVPPRLGGAVLEVPGWDPPWGEARVAVPLAAVAGGARGADAVAAALTAGARVVAPAPGEGLAGLVSATVAEALDAGPLPLADHLAALRVTFLEHAAHQRVRALLGAARVAAPPAWAGSRRVSVLVAAPAEQAQAFVESLRAQREQPAELLVAVPPGADGDMIAAAAAAAGLPVRSLPDVPGRPWWAEAARVAGSPWVYVSDGGPVPPDALLTLLAVREATGADGVGPAPGPGRAGSWAVPVSELAVSGALLRRDLLAVAPSGAGGLGARTVRRGRLVTTPTVPTLEDTPT